MTRAVPSGEGYIVELARAVRDVYRQAEDALVGVVADQVRRDIAHDTAPGNDPSTAGQDSTATRRARDEAAAVARVAAGAQRIVNRLDNALEDTVDATLESAQSEGIRQAGREIEALLHRSTRRNYRESANLAALNAFARGLVDTVRDAHRSVLRQTRDAYRQAIAETMAPKVAGASFRRRDHAQRALDRLADKGVAGFTDKAGRRWNLASYVEMATRAASARVMVDAHLDRLGTVGVDLVFVSNAPQECILCRPWEGKVLHRLGGAAGTIRVPSAVSDDLVEVKVAGTVAEAYAAGFGHPNCRHALSAFLPGATRIPTATEDPQGDADRQHLRYLERQVRRHRARAAAAVDDEARRDANRKAGAYQDRIAAHVAETGLIRQRNRERVNLGHKLEQIGRHPKLDQAAARRRDEWTISRNRLAAREQERADAEARDADQRADEAEATRLEAERAAAEAEQQRRDEAARLAEAQRQADETAAAEQAERDAAERPALPDPDTDPVDPGKAPADLTDLELEDALGASLTAEDYDRFEALSAESDRRDAARAKREAKRERDRARRQRQREERDAAREEADRLAWERAEVLIDRGMDPQAAEAEARGVDYYDIVKRDALIDLEGQGYRGGWERATRAAFELELQLEVMRAEDATRGALLNRKARARGVDPKRLFYGTEAFARANAAEELLAYWDEHGGRLTLEHFRDRLLYGAHEANRRHGGREDYHQ